MTDQKTHDAILRTMREYRLERLDPFLAEQLSRINPKQPSPVDLAVLPSLYERFRALTSALETTGLLAIPPALLPTGLAVGHHGTAVASLSMEGNVVIAGTSGSGKTSLTQLALLSAHQQGHRLLLHDPKDDMTFWTALLPRMRTIEAATPFNPIGRPPWRSLSQHIGTIIEHYRQHYYAAETQGAVLRRALTSTSAQHPSPCLADVADAILRHTGKHDTYQWRDASTGVLERLAKIEQRYPVAYRTREGIPLADIIEGDVLVPSTPTDPVGAWLTTTLLHHVFERNRANGTREVTTVAAVDEGLTLAAKTIAATNITQTGPLATLSTMNREYGLRLLITTVDLASTDDLLIQSARTIALLRGNHDTKSLRRLGLTPTHESALRHLGQGEALLVYPATLPWPVHITYPPLPEGLKDKRPVPPPDPSGVALPAAVETMPDVPVVDEPPAPLVVVGTPVDAYEQRIINHLATTGVDLVSTTYQSTGLHYSAGDKAKQRLLAKGLLTATPIIVRSGRGGRAIALTLTSAGRDLATVPLRRHSRGTAAQGEYITQALHRRLAGSTVDTDCNGKAPDLLLRVTSDHDAFIRAIAEHAISMDGHTTITIGDLVAMEVEASNPSVTIPNNLTKDRGSGLDRLLFAVLPTHVDHAVRTLLGATDDHHGLFVINALTLLDALPEAP